MCVSTSNVFHVFWLHVLPNYCNLILKQECPNPLQYSRKPASESFAGEFGLFLIDRERNCVTAEGRASLGASSLFLHMLIHALRRRRKLRESWRKLCDEKEKQRSLVS